MLDWPSFWIGVAALPVTIAAVLAFLTLLGPYSSGLTCDHCAWKFGGARANYNWRGRTEDERPRRKFTITAVVLISSFWHTRVISRTKKHRAAWTAEYERLLPNGNLRANYRPFARRLGTKGHDHH